MKVRERSIKTVEGTWDELQDQHILHSLGCGHELRERLDELGLYTMGVVWEYAARTGDDELLVAIDKYCASHPDVPLPSEVYPAFSQSQTANKARACDEIVVCHDKVVILQIELDRIKAELKEAKDSLEEAKALLIATISEVKQDMAEPQED